jgi:hypothetical protein
MKRLIQIYLTGALLLAVCEGSLAQGAGFALQFDGVNDYVDLPESASLTTGFTNQITIEAWIYSDNFLNASIIASGNQNDYAIASQPNGKLRVDLYGIDAASGGAFFSKASLTTNTWYHIAVTYNGSTETILINGQVDTARSASGTLGTSPQGEDIRIGAYNASNFFRGIIDEVRIWNIARTPAEIQQHMNTTLTGSRSGLVGYWQFDEGSGTIAYDSSGHSNNGTLINGPTWITSSTPITSIKELATQLPSGIELAQNYPNPFNPRTSIEFSIAKTGFIDLRIYNILGEEVSTLVSHELHAGTYRASWDASGFTSGVYFYRLQTGNYIETKKLLLLK